MKPKVKEEKARTSTYLKLGGAKNRTEKDPASSVSSRGSVPRPQI